MLKESIKPSQQFITLLRIFHFKNIYQNPSLLKKKTISLVWDITRGSVNVCMYHVIVLLYSNVAGDILIQPLVFHMVMGLRTV